ncbi:protein of unknown function [Streptomyces murinus]
MLQRLCHRCQSGGGGLLRTARTPGAGRLPARLVRQSAAAGDRPGLGRRRTGARDGGPRRTPGLRRPCLRQPGGPPGTGRHRPRRPPRRRTRHPGVRRRRLLRPGDGRGVGALRDPHLHPAPAPPGRRTARRTRLDGGGLRQGRTTARPRRPVRAARHARARPQLSGPAPSGPARRAVRRLGGPPAPHHRSAGRRHAAARSAGRRGLRCHRRRPDHPGAAADGAAHGRHARPRAAADRLRLAAPAGAAPAEAADRAVPRGAGARPAARGGPAAGAAPLPLTVPGTRKVPGRAGDLSTDVGRQAVQEVVLVVLEQVLVEEQLVDEPSMTSLASE